MPQSPTRKKRLLSKFLTYSLIGISLTILFYFSVSSRYSQVSKEEGGTRFTDFVYYMKNVEWFWFSDHPKIYQVDTQALIFSDLVNAKTDKLLLPHLTPIALVVWMPLAWISSKSNAAAHAVWMGVSFAVYFASMNHTYQAMRSTSSSRRIVLIALYFLATLSFSILMNITTGQTSIFITGMLTLLGSATIQGSDRHRAPCWLTVLGLTILSIKPHYYLFGLVLTSAHKRRKEILCSIAIVLVICLLLSFRLGFSWPLEYIQILSIHSQPEPPKSSEDFILLDTMVNFRGIFYPLLGYRTVSAISMLVFAIITGGSLLASFVRGWFDIELVEKSISPITLSNLMTGGYLLFSPHIYPYEDILIVAMVALTVLGNPRPFGINLNSAGVLLISALQVNPSLFESQPEKTAYWLIKLLLWGYILYINNTKLKSDSLSKPI